MTIEQKLEIIKEVLETGKSGYHSMYVEASTLVEHLCLSVFNCIGNTVKDCEEVFYMENSNERQRLDHWLEVIRLEQKNETN